MVEKDREDLRFHKFNRMKGIGPWEKTKQGKFKRLKMSAGNYNYSTLITVTKEEMEKVKSGEINIKTLLNLKRDKAFQDMDWLENQFEDMRHG